MVTAPRRDTRLAICGSTGSGKTTAGMYQVSIADIDERPWFVLDYKRDKTLRRLNMVELSLKARLPTEPGLYVFRPVPGRDRALVTALLWRIWEQENCGLYTDEGYMVGRFDEGFNALLTQGRSKDIQMITLSQRPAFMSRFVFSEADYFQIFRLNDNRDYDTIQQMISIDITSRLPPYYSRWYDVGEDKGTTWMPVPPVDDIVNAINRRLKRTMRML